MQLNLKYQEMQKSQEQITREEKRNGELKSEIERLKKQLLEKETRYDRNATETQQQSKRLNDQQELVTKQLEIIPGEIKSSGLKEIRILNVSSG